MLRETLSSFEGAGLAGLLCAFMSYLECTGAGPGLGLRLGCSLPVSPGREAQAIVTVSPTHRGQLIQLRRPLENVWPLALPERAKAEKGELALLKSPAFGSSRMALINCSRLLIGWDGKMVGGGTV